MSDTLLQSALVGTDILGMLEMLQKALVLQEKADGVEANLQETSHIYIKVQIPYHMK